MTSADPWSNIGYESYPTFATTSNNQFSYFDHLILFLDYLQTYPNQQQYYQTARQGKQSIRQARISSFSSSLSIQIRMDMIKISILTMVKLVWIIILVNYPMHHNQQKKHQSTVNYPQQPLHFLRQPIQQALFLWIHLSTHFLTIILPNKIEQWLIHPEIIV